MAATTRTRRPRGVLAAVAFALVVAACGSGVDAVGFLPAPATPRPDDHPIRIFRGTLPPCAYEEVGLLVWERRSPWHGLEDAVEDMRRRARELGGDAIVGFQLGEQTNGFTTSTQVHADTAGNVHTTSTGSVNRTRFATGTVIRYLEAACGRAGRRDGGGNG